MTRFLALALLSLAAPLSAAPTSRNFTITSFDRIRMEAPFDVTLATRKAPFARAEGSPATLDAIDLRVEGRTLIVRQRAGWNGAGKAGPVRLSLGTPDLRSVTLVGSGRLRIDRMSGLSITLGLAGPGQIGIADLRADLIDLQAGGSGAVALAGVIKKGRITAEGTSVIDAAALQSEELVIQSEGNSEVRASARRLVDVNASGSSTVTLSNPVACTQRVSGAASVSNCR